MATAAGRDPAAIIRMANVDLDITAPDAGAGLGDWAREHRFDVLDLTVPDDPDLVARFLPAVVERLRG